jgi:hypothetical protein
MGVDFTCDEKSIGFSYGGWHYIRCTLIEATFAYLDKRFAEILSKFANEEEHDWETTNIQSAAKNLQKHINEIREDANSKKQKSSEGIFGIMREHNHILDCFINKIWENYFIDLLIEFGVGGIYALCNKSDCEGFYSVGNAYDIHELLITIRSFLLKDTEDLDSEDNWLYDSSDELIELFQESIEKKKIIIIH